MRPSFRPFKELVVSLYTNPDICFLRARAGKSVLLDDCNLFGKTCGSKAARATRAISNLWWNQLWAQAAATTSPRNSDFLAAAFGAEDDELISGNEKIGIESYTLGFEEGMWALPWTETKTMRGEVLDKLLVNFVFSRGVIHSVSSKPVFIRPLAPCVLSIFPSRYIGPSTKCLPIVYSDIFQKSIINNYNFL